MPNAVDREAFTLWCQHFVGCEHIESAASFERGQEICREMRPSLLVVAPAIDVLAATKAIALLQDGLANHLLIFDERPQDATLTVVLQEPKASYFCRMSPSHSLAKAMEEMLVSGHRAFDPSFVKRLKRTANGYQLDHSPDTRSLSVLTDREREVMRLLAEGHSVKQCSALLEIAESTVENHRSRLMKKLGIHKSAELALRAVRDGLILL